MNYYIQGDAAKAEQIKAAFEKLGYEKVNVLHIGDYANERLFFFTVNGKVKSTLKDCGIVHIIKTHPDYKELELPVEPKFKVGDKVIYNRKQHTVTFVNDKYYGFSGGVAGCLIELQDQLLSPAPKPHYDIANFYAGMPVLVRADNSCKWDYSVFSRVVDNEYWHFAVCNGVCFTQCIPFNNDTKHLLGTTDMPSEEYINW